ncbi:MAG: hypothetical protein FIA91_05680 [Geobacter sp.]|nr:hypothetical protein [Geobacter sp.]
MQCDLCGKKVDFDNFSTYEGVAGSKLCRSCLSMMRVVDNPKRCISCLKEIISFYEVEGNILCESCLDNHGAAESNEVLNPTENKCERESRLSKVGIIAALIFLFSFAASFTYLMESARTNPADSGEGGVLLLPFVSPWVFMIPESLMMSPIHDKLILPLMSFFALLNSILLYFLFGGAASIMKSWKEPISGKQADSPEGKESGDGT